MSTKLLIALALAVLATLAFLANCADPLEPNGPNNTPEPIFSVDTIRIFDTISHVDTVRTFDTVFTGDTVVRVDTMTVVDTVVRVDTVNVGGKHIDTVYVVDTVSRVDTVNVVDTIIRVDTLVRVDTVTVVDTVVVYDTIRVTDTVTQVETVVVVQPDTSPFRPFCGTLSSNQQEIVWMFRNAEGDYRLEFSATLERVQPGQSLTVDIDGQKFFWDPIANPSWLSDQHLKQNSTIRITPNKPPARGHAIYVCLHVTAL